MVLKLAPGTYHETASLEERAKLTQSLRTQASQMAEANDKKYEQAAKDIYRMRMQTDCGLKTTS